MKSQISFRQVSILVCSMLLAACPAFSQQTTPSDFSFHSEKALICTLIILLLILVFAALVLKNKVNNIRGYKRKTVEEQDHNLEEHTRKLNSEQIAILLKHKDRHTGKTWLLLPITALLLIPGSDIWA